MFDDPAGDIFLIFCGGLSIFKWFSGLSRQTYWNVASGNNKKSFPRIFKLDSVEIPNTQYE